MQELKSGQKVKVKEYKILEFNLAVIFSTKLEIIEND